MPQEQFKIGDSVRTTMQLFFVDGYDPKTGQDIETMFERGARLKVHAIDEDGGYQCLTPAGTIVYLDANDIEE